MKICLYLEFFHFFKGIFFRNIGTGLLSSYYNQKKILTTLQITYTERWDKNCDILQINTPWLNSWRLIKKAKKSRKKVIIWAHVTAEDAKQVFRFTAFFNNFIKKYLTHVYGLADVILCPSTYTKSLLERYGLPAEKLMVQSNGVDTTKFYPNLLKRKEVREKQNLSNLVVGTVGLAIPRKGIADFLTIAKNLPQYTFLWYGKIYNRLLVKPLPAKIPANVKFTGYVPDVLAAFNSLDIFIFLSVEENQGMAILEAAAMQLPLPVRDLPAYQGWLKHGENCFKVKNVKECQYYINLLAQDEALRKKLGQAALLLAQKEQINTLKKQMQNVYTGLLVKTNH